MSVDPASVRPDLPPDVIFLVASCMNHDAFHVEHVGDREEVVIYTGLSVASGKLAPMKDD
jgi:hypothetical protein